LAIRERPWSAHDQVPRLDDVLAHLDDQRVDGVEPLGTAEPGGEVDGGMGAVHVQVVAVERMRLDGPAPNVGLVPTEIAVGQRLPSL
jgi:hypothetical protein